MKTLLILLLFVSILAIGQNNSLTLMDGVERVEVDTTKVMILKPVNLQIPRSSNRDENILIESYYSSIDVIMFQTVYCISTRRVYRYKLSFSEKEYFDLNWRKVDVGKCSILSFSGLEYIEIDTIQLAR